MNEMQIGTITRRRRFDRREFGTAATARTGFTLIEMMISIAIITVLISLVAVAGSRVRGIAMAKQTRQRLISLKTGLEQFKETYGYYPPLLDDLSSGERFMSVVEGARDFEDVGHYSTLTLVPYLIGVGDINLNGVPDIDGDGEDELDDGFIGEGFRDPGRDRSWGGAIESPDRKTYWQKYLNVSRDGKTLTGKVTKRLVELDDSLQRALDRQGKRITDRYLFQLMDIWETPIRYYAGWNAQEIDFDANDGLPMDWPKEWFAGILPDERESLVSELRSAPFVLLSAGPDRLATPESLDGDTATPENDEDNIMEIGE